MLLEVAITKATTRLCMMLDIAKVRAMTWLGMLLVVTSTTRLLAVAGSRCDDQTVGCCWKSLQRPDFWLLLEVAAMELRPGFLAIDGSFCNGATTRHLAVAGSQFDNQASVVPLSPSATKLPIPSPTENPQCQKRINYVARLAQQPKRVQLAGPERKQSSR